MIIEWFTEVLALMDTISFGLASLVFAAVCVWVGWFALSYLVTAFNLAFGDHDE